MTPSLVIDLRGKLPIRSGARPYYQRDVAGIVGVTVHYTASPCRSGVEEVEAIARYQVGPIAKEGFPAIAYTMMVDCGGAIYRCHDLETRCWHSGAVVNGVARNASHIGIAIINDEWPPGTQLNGLAQAILLCEAEVGWGLVLEGHKDAPYPTACPGPEWGGDNGWFWSLAGLLDE